MRKETRDAVYKLVFEYTFSKSINQRTKDMFCEAQGMNLAEIEYIERTLIGIIENFDLLTDIIVSNAKGYSSASRLNRTDYVALLYGVYELKFASDVPPVVAINEAVNIAKEYGGAKSTSFVNGILSTIYKNL